jgi:hypothetical protein
MFSIAPSQFRAGKAIPRLLLLAGAVALAALVPGTAIAASPTIERVPISLDVRLNLTSDLICGFEVWQRVSGTIIVQTRTDGGSVTARDITPRDVRVGLLQPGLGRPADRQGARRPLRRCRDADGRAGRLVRVRRERQP